MLYTLIIMIIFCIIDLDMLIRASEGTLSG
jgi:hypothetical protein